MFPWPFFNPYYIPADSQKVKLEYPTIRSPKQINFQKIKIQEQCSPVKVEQEQIGDHLPSRVVSFPSMKCQSEPVISKKQLAEIKFQMYMKNFMRPEQKKARRQNKARNFYSTLIRSFLRDFQDLEKIYSPIVEKILNDSKNDLTYKKFKAFLYQKQKKLKNYVRQNVIQKLFSEKDCQNLEKTIICKIMRILMKNYLDNHFFVCSTHRKKLQDDNYLLYLHVKRKFIKIYCCGLADEEE